MALANLTAELRDKSKLQTGGGVYISDVKEGSRAFFDGLRAGMVIRGLTYRLPRQRENAHPRRGQKIEDVEALLKKIPAGANVLGQVVRGTDRGERTFFTVFHGFRR